MLQQSLLSFVRVKFVKEERIITTDELIHELSLWKQQSNNQETFCEVSGSFALMTNFHSLFFASRLAERWS